MPRLSVDIDLTYLPVLPRDESLKAIDGTMNRIAERIYLLSVAEAGRISLVAWFHRDKAMNTGLRALPRAVRVYSTVGGMVRY